MQKKSLHKQIYKIHTYKTKNKHNLDPNVFFDNKCWVVLPKVSPLSWQHNNQKCWALFIYSVSSFYILFLLLVFFLVAIEVARYTSIDRFSSVFLYKLYMLKYLDDCQFFNELP